MGPARNHAERIRHFYYALSNAWGPQHWWPAQSRFEVLVGAFLTQNTAWTNVERAMANLRQARALSLDVMRRLPLEDLEQLVRPAGYFRQKAQRLKNFIAYLDSRYNGSLQRLFSRPTDELRQELLALNGIGPETADSILLYAGNHPVFVVDAYTRRIVDRHGIIRGDADYDEIRAMFEDALHGLRPSLPPRPAPESACSKGKPLLAGAGHKPSRVSLARRGPLAQAYNDMHAWIVGVGKNHCFKIRPKCKGCPLERFPHHAGSNPTV